MYHRLTDIQVEQLKLLINTHIQSQPTHPISLFEHMEMSTLQSKSSLLHSTSNHHKRNCTPGEKVIKQQLKFEMRFCSSSRYYPGSPWNRLINACPQEVSETLTLVMLHSLLGILNKDPATSVRRTIKKLTVPAKIYHRPAFLLLMKLAFVIFLE